jgi:hypothetical protein
MEVRFRVEFKPFGSETGELTWFRQCLRSIVQGNRLYTVVEARALHALKNDSRGTASYVGLVFGW